ncbi:MAG: chemotaxis response regulator protein-glutamate methylesterase [Cyanobacteria bacterium P01_D01_bin.105]
MLKIAIVNDMAIAVEALHRAIANYGHDLIWVARTGTEAIQYCSAQRPDLILMDLNMPELDGAEATRQIMQRSPCAILIVTASITRNTTKVFEAMGYGALDVVTTPALGTDDPQAVQILMRKIAISAKLARHSSASPADAQMLRTRDRASLPKQSNLPKLIVIGTSTGGPSALQQILNQLPSGFEAAIVVIQHIDAQFASGLVDWLNQSSQLPVALARDGDRPSAGKVLVAGTNNHLIMRPNQTLRYSHQPTDSPYRPSVDVFFDSVARHWPQSGIGLLLTGMGRDGARGMALLKSAGWRTIAESAESCVVFGMPKAAIEAGTATHVLSLPQIASYLARAAMSPSTLSSKP